MKKILALVLLGALLTGGAAVYAAGGTAADPLVSLSYLNDTYVPGALQQVSSRVNAKTQAVYETVLTDLNTRHSAYLARAGGESNGAPLPGDRRLKRGDVVTLPAGSTLTLLAGSASGAYAAGGAAVDVTAGTVLASGEALPRYHRLLAGENTTAAVTIISDTAVAVMEGYYTLSPSGSIDYNALAAALAELGLFRGTGTAYGSGYDLEVAPTRVVGLVMFLRLIGEESAALAYTGDNPFTDTPAWCDRYVAYAYGMGYTKGVGGRTFAPDTILSAGEYTTFLLRALGYSDSGAQADFSWSDALAFAQRQGVINSLEYQMLGDGAFLRAQVAYLSLYGLSAPRKDGGTLADHLVQQGGVDQGKLYSVLNSVALERLGS